jgi:peptide methionine sulfoxide reductase MsrB
VEKSLTENQYYVLRKREQDSRIKMNLMTSFIKGELFFVQLCKLPLFFPQTKFNSGNGLALARSPINNRVKEIVDRNYEEWFEEK